MHILFLLLALATIRIVPHEASRCFVSGSPKQELAKSTAVFAGKVVGRDYVPETLVSGQVIERLVIKISVNRVWKGDISAEVIMHTAKTRMANGLIGFMDEDFSFDDGSEYLVYAVGELTRLSTNACTRTRHLINADADLKELGAGQKPKRQFLPPKSFTYKCPKGDAVLPASCLEDMRIANVNRQLNSSERHQLAYLFAKSYVVSIVKYEQDYYVEHDAPIARLLVANFPDFKYTRKEGGIWLRGVFNFFRSQASYKDDVDKSLRGLSVKQRQRVVQ